MSAFDNLCPVSHNPYFKDFFFTRNADLIFSFLFFSSVWDSEQLVSLSYVIDCIIFETSYKLSALLHSNVNTSRVLIFFLLLRMFIFQLLNKIIEANSTLLAIVCCRP